MGLPWIRKFWLSLAWAGRALNARLPMIRVATAGRAEIAAVGSRSN